MSFPRNLSLIKNEAVNLLLNLIYNTPPDNPEDSLTLEMATVSQNGGKTSSVRPKPERKLNENNSCLAVQRKLVWHSACCITMGKTTVPCCYTAALWWLFVSTYKTILHLL